MAEKPVIPLFMVEKIPGNLDFARGAGAGPTANITQMATFLGDDDQRVMPSQTSAEVAKMTKAVPAFW